MRSLIAFSLDGDMASLRYRQYKFLKSRSNSSWYDATESSNCNSASEHDFLFDLDADPHEKTNLYYDDAYSDLRDELAARWKALYETEYISRTHPVSEVSGAYAYAAEDAFYESTDIGYKYVTSWGCALS